MRNFIDILDNLNIAYTLDEPMSRHTTFRAGGSAKVFLQPTSVAELKKVLLAAYEQEVKFMVIGNGSNLLFSDGEYNGAVICLNLLDEVTLSEGKIIAQAGARMSNVCNFALNNGFVGSEFMGGIPGTVGGGLFMNAGAYGGELKDIVVGANILKDGEIKFYDISELELSYRHSNVENLGVVIDVAFELKKGDVEEGRAKLAELNRKRREKQPLNYPSAGSTFKRPEGYFAGALIENAGLKGKRVGGACVSQKHAGFIVNDDNASASDIITLIEQVKEEVFNKYSVVLQPEVRIIGE